MSRESGALPPLKRWLCGMAIVLALGGCAGTTTPFLPQGVSDGPLWPEPPMKARVQWVKSIATPQDAGIAPTFWSHALELFVGAEPNNVVKPHGVLYDDAGRLFIADSGLGVVHLMDTAKGAYSRIRGPGGLPFRAPIGLAEDGAGGLFITDSAADTVYRYDIATQAVTPFLRDVARPTGIAFNKVNKLVYISETGQGRVIAVDASGAQKLTIDEAKGGEALFNKPIDLAADARGRIFVNDPLSYKVSVFTPEGVLLQRFGEMGDGVGTMNKPKGIAVDAEGRIFVCDALLDTVQLFDETGRLLFNFGATGTRAGEFWMPSGIYINKNLAFVSDTYNNRVQVYRLLGSDEEGGEPDAIKR